MRYLLAIFLCFIGRIILSLRYKIIIKGKKSLKKKNFSKEKGILFLPNHPALVDPMFISIFLWPKFKLRPLVVEYVYRQSGINFIMRLMRALSIPNLDTSLNEVKIKNAQGVIQKIIKGLKEKENFILYPSGRLKHAGKEIIGGASATQIILEGCKNVNIVLIRTTGLWGSSFSRAFTGRSPDFKSTSLRNIKYLFKNIIFFMPRRKVIIEIENAGKDFPKNGTRLEVNRYLENWYNRYPVDGKIAGEEPLNVVSYLFWKKEFLDVIKEKTKKVKKDVKYSSDLEEKIFSELNRLQPDVDITPKMHIAENLGLDSLDVAELITFLSVNFDVGDVHPEDIETVQDILDIAAGKKKVKKVEAEVAYSWPEEKRPPFEFAKGETIGETFLNSCDRMKNSSAVADDMLGVFSYKKLKLSALVLSREIKKMEGKNIGVLLPSSVGAYIVILAITLAKKVPVMLNWTSGPRYLNHMVDITNTKSIISSWRFLERISNVEFGNLTKKLRLLEDIKKEIPFKDKIKAKFLSLKRSKSLMKSLNLKSVKESDTAIILFTSGTEANPKGVVLSHKNILSNQRSAISCISVKKDAIMYGILPPFHSFGFSVAGILPILFGMRIAYSPDPTDSYTLAEGISRWGITILCAAPSFLKGVLQAATKEQLKTMHLFVTGAEKAPKELFDKVSKLGKGKKLIEGYGITECSPVITIVREEDEHKGVGKLIPGVELIIVHPETRKVLDSSLEGEICVKGDNVFSGYLEKPKKSPFLEVKGEKWYCTGDLGHLDKEGNLILSGRLKRFVKIGGEMVSLASVEEIILKELTSKKVDLGEGAPIAVCALEKTQGKSELILFTTLFLGVGDVNTILRKAGCSRLIKVSRIEKINRIPLMGSGKVDYRFLQKMLER